MITLFCIRPKAFNVGNDAIFMGLKYFIQEAFGRVVNLVSLPATARYESQAKAGLTAKTIYEINQYGHGVIVGGGNLYENGELDVQLDALERLNVPLMLFSLSCGRIYGRRRQLVTRTDTMPARTILALNRAAQFSMARDRATKEHLDRLGASNAMIGGCPTIFLDRMLPFLPPLSSADQGGVLLSVRNPELMNIPLDAKAHVHQQITDVIAYLRSEGYPNIRLLCHDHRDIPFAASFGDIEYIYADDIYVFLALLRSTSLVVTFRLHSALPCLAFGTPMIKISYDERALSLLDTVGFGGWNIDLVQSKNLVAEVIDRHRRLAELDDLRQQAQPTWDHLYATMRDAFHRFAEEADRQNEADRKEYLPPLRKSA